jgi:hypothetical protein
MLDQQIPQDGLPGNPKLIFDSLLSFLRVEMRFSAGFCGVGLSIRKT